MKLEHCVELSRRGGSSASRAECGVVMLETAVMITLIAIATIASVDSLTRVIQVSLKIGVEALGEDPRFVGPKLENLLGGARAGNPSKK